MKKLRIFLTFLLVCVVVGTITPRLIRIYRSSLCVQGSLTVDSVDCVEHFSLLERGNDSKPVLSSEDRTIAITPDGGMVAFLNKSGEIRVWSITLQRFTEVVMFDIKSPHWTILALSPDGRYLAFSQYEDPDYSLEVWDRQTQQTTSVYHGAGTISAVAFSPDGKRIVFTVQSTRLPPMNFTVELWDLISAQKIGDMLAGEVGYIEVLTFSSDGKKLAIGGCGALNAEAGCGKGEIFLWNMETGRKIAGPLRDHTSAVYALTFSFDGTMLASGSGGSIFYATPDDYSVVIWDTTTGLRIGNPLVSNGGEVLSLTFSKDGSVLAVGSGVGHFDRDSVVRLWDRSTATRIATLDGNNREVVGVVFNAQGQLVAVSKDGAIRYWGISS